MSPPLFGAGTLAGNLNGTSSRTPANSATRTAFFIGQICGAQPLRPGAALNLFPVRTTHGHWGFQGPVFRRRRLDEHTPSRRRCCVWRDILDRDESPAEARCAQSRATGAGATARSETVRWDGRGSWIRTNDLQYPKLPRYQAALYPDISERPRGYTLQPAPARRRSGASRGEIGTNGCRTAGGRPGRRAGCRISARSRRSPRGRPWPVPATE
jgi:hypothetical protein